VTIHLPPYGGVFARAGYEWNEGKRGATYMFGARLDTMPAVMVVMGLAGYFVAEALVQHDWSGEDFIVTPE
jgi:hypothetical protein